MIFINSPFAILDEAFRSLYPDKKYKACIEPSIKDDEGNRVFGFTQFSKGETPVIAISAELSITDATEIFAHELAHVAAGEEAGHGERWDEEFQRIFDEYNRIGKERFGEDGKEIETAPEYRGGWIRSEDRMPEEGEDVLVWFEYFRFGNYQRLFQTVGIGCTWRGEWSGFVNGSSGWRDLRIIAWQPLPEPYREEQAEMERLQRFEADSKQIAEMAGKPHEEVAEAILKVTTETPASLEEATQQVHERMELQAEVAAETKEESDTPFVQRWAEAKGMTVQELEQETGWTAEQLEQNIIDSSRIITTELVKAQRLMKILMTNNGRRRKGIPMVRRQQLLRAERNQRRRRSENRKES